MNANETQAPLAGWAIIELFGHRQLAGEISEVLIAGDGFLRLDMPEIPERVEGNYRYPARAATTQLYSPKAIYSLTPTDKGTAIKFLSRTIQPEYAALALGRAESDDSPESPDPGEDSEERGLPDHVDGGENP